jgi:WD40 repeat protein
MSAPWMAGALLIALESAGTCLVAEVTGPTAYVQHGPYQPQTLALSPDGRWLASGDIDGLRIYDLFTGREVRTLPYYGARKLLFAPAGNILIAAGSSGYGTIASLRFWDVQTGVPTGLDKKFDCLPSLQPVQTFALSPDGGTLAVACPGRVRLWTLGTVKEMPSLRIEHSSAFRLEFSPNGRTLTAGTFDGRILTWDFQSATLLQDVSVVAGKNVTALSSSPDGSQLAVGSHEGVQIRDAQALEKIVKSLPVKPVYAVAFHPSDKTMAIGSGLDIQTWHQPSGQLVKYGSFFLNAVAVAFSPDGRMLIAAGDSIRVWDTASKTEIHSFSRNAGIVAALSLFEDKGVLVQDTGTNALVWDLITGKLKATLNGGFQPPAGMGVRSEDGSLIASAVGQLAMLNGSDASLLYSLPGPVPLGIPVLAFSADGKELASGGADGIVRLWDLVSKRQIAAIDISAPKRMLPNAPPGLEIQDPSTLWPTTIAALAFSRDGHMLVAAGGSPYFDNHIWFWNARNGEELRQLPAGSAYISALAVDRTGARIATGRDEGVIDVWDVRSGVKTSFRGHEGRVASLLFDSAGRRLISGGEDGQIRIRDLTTNTEIIAMAATGPEDWLVFTQTGLFDGTPAAMKQVGWRLGQTNDVVAMESFYNDYFSPGLYQQAASGNAPTVAMDIAGMLQIPGLRMMLAQNSARILPRDGKPALCFDALPTANPDIFEDGQPMPFDPTNVVRFAKDAGCPYRFPLMGDRLYELIDPRRSSNQPPYRPAYDGEASDVGDSTLYVQTIAVGEYPASSGFPPLPSSVASAEAIRQFFDRQRNLTPYGHVQIEDGLYDSRATLAGIRTRLAEIAQSMKERDVLFLYFSGHGSVPLGQEMFFFVPWDVRGSDPRLESESAFSTAMLAQAIREMPASRVFIAVDACQSGGLLESLAKIGRAKAMESTAKIGIYVAASATPLQKALQQRGPNGSPFVRALIDALTPGTADSQVTARSLAADVAREASAIAAAGSATPMVVATGVDFPLAGK